MEPASPTIRSPALLVGSVVMAAWIVVGVIVGMVAGAYLVWWVIERQDKAGASREEVVMAMLTRQMEGDAQRMRATMDRLMDAVVPTREEPREESPTTGDADYEEPDDDWQGAQDWTDPLIGYERQTVARLAPGQGIPGIGEPVDDVVGKWREQGEGAFDEWARESYTPDVAAQSWVAPIDLGDGMGEVE